MRRRLTVLVEDQRGLMVDSTGFSKHQWFDLVHGFSTLWCFNERGGSAPGWWSTAERESLGVKRRELSMISWSEPRATLVWWWSGV